MEHEQMIRKLSLRMILIAAGALGLLAGSVELGAYVLHGSAPAARHGSATAPGAGAASGGAASTAGTAVPVTTARVQQGDVPIVLEGLGTVMPLNTATIRTQVPGTLETVDFVEGQDVKRGQTLARIDPRIYEAQVDQAEAALARDQATLKNAKDNLARTQPLANRGFAPQQQLDTETSQVAQAQGTVQLAQAALEVAQTQFSYTTITAPFDGVTGIRKIDPGNIVQPSDPNGLVVLTQLQPIGVIFTLPATNIPDVQNAIASGQAAVDAYDGSNQQKLDHGSLMLIDNQADSSTGTVRLKASFPNAKKNLWPGSFVNVHLTIAVSHNALTVPLAAVQQGPNGSFVYVVGPDNKVSARAITVGQSRGGQAVLNKGVSANETVVVAGQYRLSEGATVQVVPDDRKDLVQHASTASAGMLP
jgi:membrane fusion protein, multidrug efflux system